MKRWNPARDLLKSSWATKHYGVCWSEMGSLFWRNDPARSWGRRSFGSCCVKRDMEQLKCSFYPAFAIRYPHSNDSFHLQLALARRTVAFSARLFGQNVSAGRLPGKV